MCHAHGTVEDLVGRESSGTVPCLDGDSSGIASKPAVLGSIWKKGETGWKSRLNEAIE